MTIGVIFQLIQDWCTMAVILDII